MNHAQSTNPWLLIRYDSERHIQMLSVLERYGIGSPDQNRRGTWITKAMSRKVAELIRAEGAEYVRGSDGATHIWAEDFERLWHGG